MAATAARIAEVLAGLRAASARLGSAAALEVPRLSLGIDALDAALGGGLPRGKLVELCGARSSGRLSLTLNALSAAQATGELVALVDVADALDPRSAEDAGLQLDRLLWVRPKQFADGLRAADRVLDAGGFGLVALYAAGVALRVSKREHLSAAVWARLQQRAERSRAAVLLIADRPMAGSFSVATLEARAGRAHFIGDGRGRLLAGADASVTVSRSRLAAPGDETAVTWEKALGASERSE